MINAEDVFKPDWDAEKAYKQMTESCLNDFGQPINVGALKRPEALNNFLAVIAQLAKMRVLEHLLDEDVPPRLPDIGDAFDEYIFSQDWTPTKEMALEFDLSYYYDAISVKKYNRFIIEKANLLERLIIDRRYHQLNFEKIPRVVVHMIRYKQLEWDPRKIAEMFGVPVTVARNIISGLTYRYVKRNLRLKKNTEILEAYDWLKRHNGPKVKIFFERVNGEIMVRNYKGL